MSVVCICCVPLSSAAHASIRGQRCLCISKQCSSDGPTLTYLRAEGSGGCLHTQSETRAHAQGRTSPPPTLQMSSTIKMDACKDFHVNKVEARGESQRFFTQAAGLVGHFLFHCISDQCRRVWLLHTFRKGLREQKFYCQSAVGAGPVRSDCL